MLKDALTYLNSLLTQTPRPERLDSHDLDYLVVPEHSNYFDLDKYRDRPRRLVQTVEFAALESLIGYIKRWSGKSTMITGDRDSKHQIKAVLDYHSFTKDERIPSWCEHVAILKALVTPEWRIWTDGEKKHMSQRTFAAFLEDNAEDIETDLAGLLTQVKNVTIGQSGSTKSRVSTVENDLTAHKNVSVASGLPDFISLGLSPWRHSDPYKVKARPFIHFEEGKAPEFSYHLINLEKVLDTAFLKAVKTVKEGTGYEVYV